MFCLGSMMDDYSTILLGFGGVLIVVGVILIIIYLLNNKKSSSNNNNNNNNNESLPNSVNNLKNAVNNTSPAILQQFEKMAIGLGSLAGVIAGTKAFEYVIEKYGKDLVVNTLTKLLYKQGLENYLGQILGHVLVWFFSFHFFHVAIKHV